MDNQQGPTVKHIELCSLLCGSPDGRGVWGTMHTCICMAVSLRSPPETITMLSIDSTPIQNKKLKKLNNYYFLPLLLLLQPYIAVEKAQG